MVMTHGEVLAITILLVPVGPRANPLLLSSSHEVGSGHRVALAFRKMLVHPADQATGVDEES